MKKMRIFAADTLIIETNNYEQPSCYNRCGYLVLYRN